MSQYLNISIPADPELHDMIIAELSEINFDSFQEFEDHLDGFIKEEDFDEMAFNQVLARYKITDHIHIEKLENINWNEQWEKNFEPVHIEGRVLIRATFHPSQTGFDYEIIVDPKMSFGTGHHETTYLMVSEQLKISHEGKRFLDVGTGTGVLGIMAHKLGASVIIATDIDDWCIENCQENFNLNSVDRVEVFKGTIDNLTLPGSFDIICANINKNVLLSEIPIYSKLLAKDGILMLSGFYQEDMKDLRDSAAESQLKQDAFAIKNRWAMLRLSHARP